MTHPEQPVPTIGTPDTAPSSTPEDIARGLFPHQVEGVAFLLRRRRAILADDMGLGKTRQAITALKVEEPTGPYLVICPASVKRNWEREIRLVLPPASVRILGGSGARDADPLPGAEWVVVNYDILRRHAERLAATPWRGVIVDEAHYLRNHQSQRSRAVRALVEALEDPVVYMLTGTPLANRPRDLFPLLQLAGHSLGRSFLSYAKRYCAAYHNDFGWVTDGASNLEELAVELRGLMLRRSKDEVLDLPPKLRAWLPAEVPPGTGDAETARVVRLLLEGRGPGGSSGAARRRDAGGGRGRARLLATLTTLRRKLAVAKVPQTLELVEGAVEQGEKVIVFSCFDEPVRRLAARFGERAVVLTGATPSGARQALVDRFQNEEGVRVFVANLLAGGVGLNLTAARQVVFNDLDWVPSNHWQAEDRAYRIGQTRTVNVTYLVAAGTVDEFVQTVLETKTALIGAVVEGEALDGTESRDALAELERMLAALSPQMADTRLDDLGREEIEALLRRATAELQADLPAGRSAAARPAAGAGGETEAMRRALDLLRQALAGPATTRYKAASSSGGGEYDLVVDAAGDVECSCPGFAYRGMCSHARKLRAVLAGEGALPSGLRAA